MSRWRHPVVLVGLGVACALLILAGVAASVLWSLYQHGRQIHTLIDLREYRRRIEIAKQETGSIPPDLEHLVALVVAENPNSFLAEGVDRWGNPIVYLPTENSYWLISYGRDGVPDGTDYAAIRNMRPVHRVPCPNLDADIVFSEIGEHHSCGK